MEQSYRVEDKETGTVRYFKTGEKDMLHNISGPAVVYENGKYEYWNHGILLTEDQFVQMKLKIRRLYPNVKG